MESFTEAQNNKQINCLIDCRISSSKQLDGGGLENQENTCTHFATRNGWKIQKVFSKVYSGRAEEREDFEEIIAFIERSKKSGTPIHKYIVKSIDRFTRDGVITFQEMKNRLDYLGVDLTDVFGCIQPNINTLDHLGMSFEWSMRSPTASIQFMEAQRAKEEVTDILTRTIGAEISLVREGYKVRKENDGFINKKIFIDGKKKVIEVPDPDRAHFFCTMFELRARGVDDKEIVSRVNAMGFRTKTHNVWDKKKMKIIGKRGKKPLSVKMLQIYIKRPIYAGIKCEKWTSHKPIKAKYDGLVSIDIFNRANRGKIFIQENADGTVQFLRDVNQKTKRLKNNPDYPFKFLLCPLCKKQFLGSASRGKLGKTYPAYHCGGGSRIHKHYRIPKKDFEESIKQLTDSLKFENARIQAFELVLKDVYKMREKEVVSQLSSININVEELKIQQASILDILTVTQSPIARKKMEEKIEELEQKIKSAEEEQKKIGVTEKDIEIFISFAKKLMEHPSELLMDIEDIQVQRTLFGLVFKEMPTYEEIVNGTPKLSLVYKLSEENWTSESLLVPP